jgi:hypothetical protein
MTGLDRAPWPARRWATVSRWPSMPRRSPVGIATSFAALGYIAEMRNDAFALSLR